MECEALPFSSTVSFVSKHKYSYICNLLRT